MHHTELFSRKNYFLAFENFIAAPAPGCALRLVCRGSENETDLLLNLDGTVDRWQIDFQSYAFYSATAEDFSFATAPELHEASACYIHEDSGLLRFLKQSTNLEEQQYARSVSYRHVAFACMEHQVDVVSAHEPSVQLVEKKRDTV